MTRKHFELIARAFRTNKPSLSSEDGGYTSKDIWDDLVYDMCAELKSLNQQFDAARFRAASKGE